MPPVGMHQFLFPKPSQILEYQLATKEAGFELPPLGEYAVGMFSCPFLKVGWNKAKSYSQSRGIAWAHYLDWQLVPTDNSELGKYALQTEPIIEQVLLTPTPKSEVHFEQ
ncbi:glutamate synthase 1 [NADH], chloroplastic-like [Olea europaea var. sylvestris]|uniref:glutamate synthase 1 [NADH], chloroplastic-like n=1 Tax=Olea europaea var. sylvestris TaxID=158386 RepID=UPI000C1D1313|nr:glutamate synthase 1 [NADH], chloroplastic-like [Olea europaea var. sylvestris]